MRRQHADDHQAIVTVGVEGYHVSGAHFVPPSWDGDRVHPAMSVDRVLDTDHLHERAGGGSGLSLIHI